MPGPPDPLIGVTITAREIYEGVVRLTGRVDVLIEQQGAVREDITDHEQRLRSLEASRWPLPAASVLLALAALALVLIPMLT